MSHPRSPGDFIVLEGELADEMFLLRRGRAEVIKKSEPQKVLSAIVDGEHFGESALILERGLARRTVTIRASRFCDMSSLSQFTVSTTHPPR